MLNESSAAVESIPTQENDLYTNFLNVTKDRVNRWTKDNPITNGYPRIIDAYGEYLGLDNYMITSSQITRASMLEKYLTSNSDHYYWVITLKMNGSKGHISVHWHYHSVSAIYS